jgi:hypothetical protein
VLDIFWTRGLVEQFAGDTEAALADLTRAATLAASAELNWEQCDCLVRLALIAIERGQPAEALPLCARLAAVAEKMGEGYEAPMAETLSAIARAALGRAGAATELAVALDQLRAADAKSMLSHALNLCAGLALDSGDRAGAEAYATEALQAASAVDQKSQQAIARASLARLALAAGDSAAAHAHLHRVAADLNQPQAVSARARAAVEVVRALIDQASPQP